METRSWHPDLALSGSPGASPQVASPRGSSRRGEITAMAAAGESLKAAPVASAGPPQHRCDSGALPSGTESPSAVDSLTPVSAEQRCSDPAIDPPSLPPQPLLGMSLADLQGWCAAQGQPSFRAKQLHDWIYARGARSIAAITVLPKAWRQQLAAAAASGASACSGIHSAGRAIAPSAEAAAGPADPVGPGSGPAAPEPAPDPACQPVTDAWIGRSRELRRSVSRDRTVKLLLGTSDGLSLETVGIPSGDRLTVCVSSQVGCPMACRFCATGKGGLQRSLAVHEIVDQVLAVREVMQRRPSHVVFMGMGEPLLNLEAVLAAIDCLCSDLGMAQRQITVSTVGVPAALPSLAERALQRLGRAQFTLAVSLHAPDQALRQRLIPTAHAYPIEQLLEDCRRYVAITGRRVSFEYILLGGVNDQPRHAEALARLLRGFQSHVNLIAYNPIAEEDFRRPGPEAVDAFRRALLQRRIAATVRASRGLDADAACGQLRRRQLQGASAG